MTMAVIEVNLMLQLYKAGEAVCQGCAADNAVIRRCQHLQFEFATALCNATNDQFMPVLAPIALALRLWCKHKYRC